MIRFAIFAMLTAFTVCCRAQNHAQDIPPERLQAVLDLPLGQAIQAREVYKAPLNLAYKRQMALADKDCLSEQGQQLYNICMGKANVQADSDYTIFYNNLQMLCHVQSQLSTLQASEKSWERYKDDTMHATNRAWPDGTGAPGFAGFVYVSLLRDRMRELALIYGLNISQ